MIHCDDFDGICRQIADGIAIFGSFHFRANYPSLKYFQFNTDAHVAKVIEHHFPCHMISLMSDV
jgi:hypothetical protein